MGVWLTPGPGDWLPGKPPLARPVLSPVALELLVRPDCSRPEAEGDTSHVTPIPSPSPSGASVCSEPIQASNELVETPGQSPSAGGQVGEPALRGGREDRPRPCWGAGSYSYPPWSHRVRPGLLTGPRTKRTQQPSRVSALGKGWAAR